MVGYEPGQGSHTDLGSLLVATHEAGALALRRARWAAASMRAPATQLRELAR